MHRAIRFAFAIAAFVFLLSSAAHADGVEKTALSKYDARLRMMLHQRQLAALRAAVVPADDMLHVFVRGDGSALRQEIEQHGGVVGTVLPLLVTARIPASRIEGVAALSSVEYIEAASPMELHNDSLVADIGADRVHRGTMPLDRSYTGKGVLVGIIDSGIDFTHAEFRDPADSTRSRILAIWSHMQTQGAAPKGFDYGVEYTQAQIEDELDGSPAGFVLQNDNQIGHGTHVAATAAGNNGVAPEASIVVVQLDFEQENVVLTSFVDAVAYIYAKADELGMPCVINASLGQRLGVTHSGDDAASQAIDQLVHAKPGRIFCASAGNDGELKTHWGGFPVEQDSLWIYSFRQDGLYFEVPASDTETLEIAVECDSLGSSNGKLFFVPVGATPWWTPASLADIGSSTLTWLCTTSGVPHDTSAVITFTASKAPSGRVDLMLSMRRFQSKLSIYRIKVRGSGTFHSWGRYVDDPEHTSGGLPFNSRYRPTDNLMQVGVPGVSRGAITVGCYINRYSYTDTSGIERLGSGRPVGELSVFSSSGPTSDGRLKPDIAAPGERVVSARVVERKDVPSTIVGDGRYMVRSGTSMSAPAVAGAVALYMEKHPLSSFSEVYNVLTGTAAEDSFTASHGSLPNNTWGYGKLDIFAAMTNLAASASVLDNGVQTTAYPNPTSSYVYVQFGLVSAQRVVIDVYDTFGRRKFTAFDSKMAAGEHTATVSTAELTAGTYMYRLQAGQRVQTGVFTVVR